MFTKVICCWFIIAIGVSVSCPDREKVIFGGSGRHTGVFFCFRDLASLCRKRKGEVPHHGVHIQCSLHCKPNKRTLLTGSNKRAHFIRLWGIVILLEMLIIMK
jgi:hypothetical protein